MMRRTFLIGILSFLLLVFSFLSSWAEKKEKSQSLQSIEVLTGYGMAKIRSQKTYRILPVFVDFNFALKPITKKIGFDPPGLLQFVLEPFLAYSYSPHNNAEVGTNFLIKIGILPESSKFQPYFKGGLGLIYLTQHTQEQATQFNFNEYVGVGIHYFFKKNIAFTAEYRYRHISNAGIDHPNKGINTNFTLCGISCRF